MKEEIYTSDMDTEDESDELNEIQILEIKVTNILVNLKKKEKKEIPILVIKNFFKTKIQYNIK